MVFFSWLILEFWGSRYFQRFFKFAWLFVQKLLEVLGQWWNENPDSLRYSFSTSRFCYCSLATKKIKHQKKQSSVMETFLVFVFFVGDCFTDWDPMGWTSPLNPPILADFFGTQPPNSRKSHGFLVAEFFGSGTSRLGAGCVIHRKTYIKLAVGQVMIAKFPWGKKTLPNTGILDSPGFFFVIFYGLGFFMGFIRIKKKTILEEDVWNFFRAPNKEI